MGRLAHCPLTSNVCANSKPNCFEVTQCTAIMSVPQYFAANTKANDKRLFLVHNWRSKPDRLKIIVRCWHTSFWSTVSDVTHCCGIQTETTSGAGKVPEARSRICWIRQRSRDLPVADRPVDRRSVPSLQLICTKQTKLSATAQTHHHNYNTSATATEILPFYHKLRRLFALYFSQV